MHLTNSPFRGMFPRVFNRGTKYNLNEDDDWDLRTRDLKLEDLRTRNLKLEDI